MADNEFARDDIGEPIFESARIFIDRAEEAYKRGDKGEFTSCCKLIFVALGLRDYKLHTGHLGRL